MELLTTKAASNASTEDVQLAHQTTLHMKVASTANTTTTNLSRKRETWANLRVILRRTPWTTKLMEEKLLPSHNLLNDTCSSCIFLPYDVAVTLMVHTFPAVQMSLCLWARLKSWYFIFLIEVCELFFVVVFGFCYAIMDARMRWEDLYGYSMWYGELNSCNLWILIAIYWLPIDADDHHYFTL